MKVLLVISISALIMISGIAFCQYMVYKIIAGSKEYDEPGSKFKDSP